jgi:hypothetical protein
MNILVFKSFAFRLLSITADAETIGTQTLDDQFLGNIRDCFMEFWKQLESNQFNPDVPVVRKVHI